MSVRQSLRDIIARAFLTVGTKKTRILLDPRYFSLWETNGFHITPNHFSMPIPDLSKLKDDVWQPSQLAGVDMNEEQQINLLSTFSSQYKNEYDGFPRERTRSPHQYYVHNIWFDSVDGEILYCMVRHFKPKRIFEIGSGNTTYLSAQAVLKNKETGGHQCELIACEPYPNETLKNGFPGLSQLVTTEVQKIPLSEFDKLQDDDILFIDSSHVLKAGSDVQYEFLEVLPRLNKGVVIHIHDIFFPEEYPKDWIMHEHQFCNEQYLLQAFLAFNDSFEVLWGGNYIHLKYPDKLEAAFGSYKKEGKPPRSFWIRKIK